MSTEALFRISDTIRKGLQQAVGDDVLVKLETPGDANRGGQVLSWWLYQVTEDEFTRNAPAPTSDPKKQAMPPLRVNLHYLLTPLCGSREEDQRVLGKAMRWLYENALFPVSDPDVTDTLRLSIGLADLDGLSNLWQSLRQDFRLSVGYLVRTARVQPDRQVDVPLVRTGEGVLGGAPPASEEGGL